MTSPTTTPTPPPIAKAATGASGGVEGVDINKVISGSTSDVAITELTKKGFKHVKVLNQGMITRLISEAVDRVIDRRFKTAGKEDREKIIHESMAQFEAMAKERLARERDRISELERANATLLAENESLGRRIHEREEEIRQLQGGEGAGADKLSAAILEKLQGMGGAPGGDITALQKSIQAIAAKLDRLPGKVSEAEVVDKEALIDALFRVDSPDAAESNIDKIKVKQAKAGGVKDTLAKLKALQKGGSDGD